ncbi:MAG: hypothetical protein D3924_00415 [Candidatus Electrothrix sp. AR4]|nr:hypothetical protein [Candidatus Electrothrix sp. AR4]
MNILFFNEKNEKEDTLSSLCSKEIWCAVLNVGTWWSTIVSLIFICLLMKITSDDALNFYVPLTYCVGLSMLISAPLNGLISDALSDDIFKEYYHTVLNTLTGALTIVLLLAFALTFLLHLCFSKQSYIDGLIFSVLTASMSALWVCINVMTVLKKKRGVLWSFWFGLTLTLILSIGVRYFLLPLLHLTPETLSQVLSRLTMAELSLGFTLAAGIQYGYLFKTYQYGKMEPEYSWFRVTDKNKVVFFFFLFFNLGMWIDKILYWYWPDVGKKLNPEELFFRYSDYDTPFFWAFTLFSFCQLLILRRLEELLQEPQKSFYEGLNINLPFKHLDEKKQEFIAGYRKILNSIFFLYGPIVFMLLSSISMNFIELPWENPFVFHLLLIATLVLGIFFLNLIVLQYTDQYLLAMLLCAIFLLLNFAGTYLVIFFDLRSYQGAGFLTASLVTTAISWYFVEHYLGRLEYVATKNIAIF